MFSAELSVKNVEEMAKIHNKSLNCQVFLSLTKYPDSIKLNLTL